MARWDQDRNCWRIVLDATRPGQARRRRYFDFKAPNDTAGKKAAELEEARRLVELADELETDWPGAGAGPSSFAAAALDWCERNRGAWSPKTTKETKYALRRYILPTIGATELDDLTPRALLGLYGKWETAVSQATGKPYAASSRRRWHGIVAAVLNDADKLGELKRNPIDKVTPAGGKAPERESVVSTADLVKVIEAAPSVATEVYFRLAADTGARRGTVVALRWRNLDTDAGTATFTRAITVDEDNVEVEKETKAKRAYACHLSGPTLEALRDHRKRALETAMALGLAGSFDDLFVFSKDGGETHWDLGWPSHAWTKAARRAGVRTQGLHDLRHYAATWMLTARIPDRVVAERLGCTVANIHRTYSHYVPSAEDARAAEVMAGLWAAAQ